MSTSIRTVDRGAWLSVNGNRELGISDLWPLARSDLCECHVTDFLAEGFAEIGVDPPNIEARFTGRCITCGTEGTTGWLLLGRVVNPADGDFLGVDPDHIHIPDRQTTLTTSE
nr:hypothetical protein [Halalkalicoccus subterraneus]